MDPKGAASTSLSYSMSATAVELLCNADAILCQCCQSNGLECLQRVATRRRRYDCKMEVLALLLCRDRTGAQGYRHGYYSSCKCQCGYVASVRPDRAGFAGAKVIRAACG